MNKDLIIIITGRVFQILITLISVRILTALLSPEEVGNYYIAMTIIAFINLVFLNPPSTYLSRNLLELQRDKNLLNSFLIFISWTLIVAFFSVFISIILFNTTNYGDKFDYRLFILFIFLATTVSTIHRNLIYGSNTMGFRKEFVLFLIVTLIFGLIFSCYLVYFVEPSSLYWLFGIIVSEFIILLFAFRFYIQGNTLDFNKIKESINHEKFNKLLKFSIPIGVTTFLMWGLTMSYRFVVDFKYSAETLGYIVVGLGVSSAVFSSLESIAMQYFSPIFLKDIFESTKTQRSEAWIKMASSVIPLYILALFFTICMSEILVSILVDSKFHDSYRYTIVGASIEFFRVVSNLLTNVSQSEYKTNSTIKPHLIGFLIAILCLLTFNFNKNLVMIPIVLSLSNLLVCYLMYLQMKKLLDIKFKIDFFKILVLSTPFGLIYLFPSSKSFTYSIIYLIIFSTYLLFSFWIILKNKSIGNFKYN